MKRFILSSLLLALFVSAVSAQSTLFIVRHAEKAKSGGDDPDVTTEGRARAEQLATMLKDVGVAAIYATEFKRTQQTAAPLAKALGIDVTILPAKDTAALTSKVRDLKKNALIVGHANTIPDLLKALGIVTPIAIGDNDYDNLFIVVLEEKPQFIRLHFR